MTISALASAYRDMAEAYTRVALRQKSPVVQQYYMDKGMHFHDLALEREAKCYQTNTEERR